MKGVTFTVEGNETCHRENCNGCRLLKRDMDIFGLAFRRKTKELDGSITCEWVDPRTVRYVPPDRYEVIK